jgi:hypothetical protein
VVLCPSLARGGGFRASCSHGSRKRVRILPSLQGRCVTGGTVAPVTLGGKSSQSPWCNQYGSGLPRTLIGVTPYQQQRKDHEISAMGSVWGRLPPKPAPSFIAAHTLIECVPARPLTEFRNRFVDGPDERSCFHAGPRRAIARANAPTVIASTAAPL